MVGSWRDAEFSDLLESICWSLEERPSTLQSKTPPGWWYMPVKDGPRSHDEGAGSAQLFRLAAPLRKASLSEFLMPQFLTHHKRETPNHFWSETAFRRNAMKVGTLGICDTGNTFPVSVCDYYEN